jgi:hypothetical protein
MDTNGKGRLILSIVLVTIDGVRTGNWIYWHLIQSTRTYKQYSADWFTQFAVHRYTRTRLLSLHQSYPGNGIKNSLTVTTSSNHTLSLHRLTSNSSSTTNFPCLHSVVLRYIPHLLFLDSVVNFQFQFSNVCCTPLCPILLELRNATAGRHLVNLRHEPRTENSAIAL